MLAARQEALYAQHLQDTALQVQIKAGLRCLASPPQVAAPFLPVSVLTETGVHLASAVLAATLHQHAYSEPEFTICTAPA